MNLDVSTVDKVPPRSELRPELVVWDDAGLFRSIYIPAILKVERLEP
jgi:hypothetical protein